MSRLEKLCNDKLEIYWLPPCVMIKTKQNQHAFLTINKIPIDSSQGKDAYNEGRR